MRAAVASSVSPAKSVVVERPKENNHAPPPAEGVRCPKCAASNSRGLAFCEACGTALTSQPARRRTRLAPALIAVLVAVAGVAWHYWGVRLTITTEPGSAEVVLAEVPAGTTGPDGVLEIAHVRRGQQTIRVRRAGFDDWEQPLSIGWGAFAQSLAVTLKPSIVTVTLYSLPPETAVLLDGQPATVETAADTVVIRSVARGRHVIAVRRPGYFDWQSTIDVDHDWTLTPALVPNLTGRWVGRTPSMFGDVGLELEIVHTPSSITGTAVSRSGGSLALSAVQVSATSFSFAYGGARYQGSLSGDRTTLGGSVESMWAKGTWSVQRQSLTSADSSSGAADSAATDGDRALQRARNLFERRQYNDALAACDEVLRLEPGHVEGQKLKEQIQKTMAILGITGHGDDDHGYR